MNNAIQKTILCLAANLVSGMMMAQSGAKKPVAIKDYLKNYPTEQITIRELKKKELVLAPSKFVLLNHPSPVKRKEKSEQRKE